jgi:hypothetical protein
MRQQVGLDGRKRPCGQVVGVWSAQQHTVCICSPRKISGIPAVNLRAATECDHPRPYLHPSVTDHSASRVRACEATRAPLLKFVTGSHNKQLLLRLLALEQWRVRRSRPAGDSCGGCAFDAHVSACTQPNHIPAPSTAPRSSIPMKLKPPSSFSLIKPKIQPGFHKHPPERI